jgi:hypothetical protein
MAANDNKDDNDVGELVDEENLNNLAIVRHQLMEFQLANYLTFRLESIPEVAMFYGNRLFILGLVALGVLWAKSSLLMLIPRKNKERVLDFLKTNQPRGDIIEQMLFEKEKKENQAIPVKLTEVDLTNKQIVFIEEDLFNWPDGILYSTVNDNFNNMQKAFISDFEENFKITKTANMELNQGVINGLVNMLYRFSSVIYKEIKYHPEIKFRRYGSDKAKNLKIISQNKVRLLSLYSMLYPIYHSFCQSTETENKFQNMDKIIRDIWRS